MKDLNVESSKELSLILFGMKLGKSLSFDVEYYNEYLMQLGDFDGAGLSIHKSGAACTGTTYGDAETEVYLLAMIGAWAEAKEESERFYQQPEVSDGDS